MGAEAACRTEESENEKEKNRDREEWETINLCGQGQISPWRPPKQAGGGGGHCVPCTADPCLFYDVFK